MLFFLLLMVPLGNSANEVLGRVSNLGFLAAPAAVLLVLQRERVHHSLARLMIDALLVVLCGSNPAIVLLLALYLGGTSTAASP